jgi:DeoR/GlpR family transcriptional regulator of sugar metabolism
MRRFRSGKGSYTHIARRRFVRESLSPGGRLPFVQVKEHFAVSDGALYADAQHFKRLNLPITVDDHAFVMADIRPETAARSRAELNVGLKRAIARLAADLIVGPAWRVTPGTAVDFLREHCLTLEGRERSSQPILASARRRTFFERFWKKHHRVLTIDAGTTTLEIGRALSKIVLPQASTGLYALNIMTNSPNLAVQMAGSAHTITVLGGKMTDQTEAIAGSLAEQCLERWQFVTDLALLGATALDLARGFGCDTAEEGVIKNLFLERTQFRIIVMDSTKIQVGLGSAATFCPWTADAVDMLITDHGALELPVEVRRELQASGIEVLLATPADALA